MDDEREPTEIELRTIAFDNLQMAIEDVISSCGEDNTAMLTDWAVVFVSAAVDSDGDFVASPTGILPREGYLPPHRIKGLLVDALDRIRGGEIIYSTYIDQSGEEDE